jgi:indolepyruvate ferredoxin oxidoreductase beta subunit
MDPLNLIISGIGGQGNILLSRMIGRILTRKAYLVNIGETFGAAQRGGAVYSSMRVSKKKNYGPLIPEGCAHLILSLEPLEALRMLTLFGNPEVITVTNLEPIYPVGVLSKRLQYPDLEKLKRAVERLSGGSWFVNATRLALGLDAPIVANIVMLGALAAVEEMPVTKEDVEDEIRNSFPAPKVSLNLEAMHAGMEAVS